MSGFSNFAVSFSIISILAGCITSYGIALVSGAFDDWCRLLIVGLVVLPSRVDGRGRFACPRPAAHSWSGRLAEGESPQHRTADQVAHLALRSGRRVPSILAYAG